MTDLERQLLAMLKRVLADRSPGGYANNRDIATMQAARALISAVESGVAA